VTVAPTPSLSCHESEHRIHYTSLLLVPAATRPQPPQLVSSRCQGPAGRDTVTVGHCQCPVTSAAVSHGPSQASAGQYAGATRPGPEHPGGLSAGLPPPTDCDARPLRWPPGGRADRRTETVRVTVTWNRDPSSQLVAQEDCDSLAIIEWSGLPWPGPGLPIRT
jgi:hypothetical protein